MPLPPPVPQEWLDHLEEIDPPPPLPRDADIKVQDPPGMLPSIIAQALPLKKSDQQDERTGPEPGEVQPAAAELEDERSWASLIPSVFR